MNISTEIDNILTSHDFNPLINKKILITGASSGIGLACACKLAELGCNLILVARRAEKLGEIKTELLKRYSNIKIDICIADVNTDIFYEKMHEIDGFNVDVLINNAGLARGLDTIDIANISDWQEMINTNIISAFKIIHTTLPYMIKNKFGHIINISSIAGLENYDKGSVYCATKHALHSFSKILRSEVCDKNIKVSIISPGMVNTEFSTVRFHGDRDRANQVYVGIQPLIAKDIAKQIIYCLMQDEHVNIDELLITPIQQGSSTKIYRQNHL